MASRKAAFNFTKIRQESFLQLMRSGKRRGAAADIVFDVDDPDSPQAAAIRRKVRDYITANPDFEDAVLDAETEANEHVDEAVYQAAISGSVAAAKAWWERIGVVAPAERGRPSKPTDPEAPGPVGDPFTEVASLEARRAQREGRS